MIDLITEWRAKWIGFIWARRRKWTGARSAGRRAVTGDTVPRLSEALGTTPEFWMNLQSGWELEMARGVVRARIERVA